MSKQKCKYISLVIQQINKITYGSGLSVTRGYEDNGIDTINKDYIRVKDTISTKKLSFKDAFLQYAEIKAGNPLSPQLLAIEKEQPLVREAYHKLGEDKVRSLRYVKKSVENALTSLENDKTTEQKIAKMVINSIETPDTIKVSKANRIIEEAYKHLGIEHKAKAKELHKWFECSDPISMRIDGQVVKAVKIYRAKFIFNK